MSSDSVFVTPDNYTAQAIIITDAANNQITAFHPGAMKQAHEAGLPAAPTSAAIIGPGRPRRDVPARPDLAQRDPVRVRSGPGPADVRRRRLAGVHRPATWVTVNDYEGKMLCERIGLSLAELSRSHLEGIIVTLGDQGCEVWEQGRALTFPAWRPPRSRSDRLRRRIPRRTSVRPGAGLAAARLRGAGQSVGAVKIAYRGGQNHAIDRAAMQL